MTSIGSSFRVLAHKKKRLTSCTRTSFQAACLSAPRGSERGAREAKKRKQLVGQRCVKRQRGWKIGDQAATADEEAGVVVGETCRASQKNGKTVTGKKLRSRSRCRNWE